MYRAGEALFSAVKIGMLKKHKTIDEQKLKEVQSLYEYRRSKAFETSTFQALI